MLGMAPVAPPATQAASGLFIDAPIAGIDRAPASAAGSSDSEGRLLYNTGESLRSSIGTALHPGRASGGAVLSPLDLVPAPAGCTAPASGPWPACCSHWMRTPRRVTPFFFPGILLRFAGL